MEKKKTISIKVIRRLPTYHRHFHEILNKGVSMISSKELSRKTGFTATQIRQDLNKVGGFGAQGQGYSVRKVYDHICKVLNINRENNAVIIGAGNVGYALANYKYFENLGLNIVGIFEVNPKKLGIRIGNIEIQDLDYLPRFLENNQVKIGVICVPENSAQSICEILTNNGIKGIWNFAAVDLIVPKDVVIENVHLSSSILVLSYRMSLSIDTKQISSNSKVLVNSVKAGT